MQFTMKSTASVCALLISSAAAAQTEPLSGRIGLQSEGGEMKFQKMELTPIESERAGRTK